MLTDAILAEIKAEREYQEGRWGAQFDDKNTVSDWAAYIGNYTGRATSMSASKVEQRLNLMKAAAIAVAAVESFDRNNGFAARHFD